MSCTHSKTISLIYPDCSLFYVTLFQPRSVVIMHTVYTAIITEFGERVLDLSDTVRTRSVLQRVGQVLDRAILSSLKQV